MTTGNSSLKHLDELVDPDITAKVRIKQTNKKSAITIPTKLNRGETQVTFIWSFIVDWLLFNVRLLVFQLYSWLFCKQGRIQGGGAHPARPPHKIGKNMICWRKIVIFHTKYPKNFRAPSARRNFLSAPPLTWNPGSAPGKYNIV